MRLFPAFLVTVALASVSAFAPLSVTRSVSFHGNHLLWQSSSATSSQTSSSSSSTASAESKSWQDDGFVFGLEGSGLARPTGRQAQIVVEGDSLETQPYQIAMVAATFTGHACFLAHSVMGMHVAHGGNIAFTVVQTVCLAVTSWLLADFGSGVLHWSVDNYGNGKTPIMGGIISAFQGHHAAPWTITQRGFCNNVYKLCVPFGIVPISIINTVSSPAVTFFMTTFCIFEILSQEFHKWSHQIKSERPAWVQALQKAKLTIPPAPHAKHHLEPYEGNYCIISGIHNQWLDESGFFRKLERLVYRWNGVEPNCWKLDAGLKQRTLDGDYSLSVIKK